MSRTILPLASGLSEEISSLSVTGKPGKAGCMSSRTSGKPGYCFRLVAVEDTCLPRGSGEIDGHALHGVTSLEARGTGVITVTRLLPLNRSDRECMRFFERDLRFRCSAIPACLAKSRLPVSPRSRLTDRQSAAVAGAQVELFQPSIPRLRHARPLHAEGVAVFVEPRARSPTALAYWLRVRG
mgnify:CR=1 FL=1